MDADLRIRLEGKVEQLEAAVFAWEAAAASLLAERWRAPGRWKSLLQSNPSLPALEAAIEAKAPGDADVAMLSGRLRQAREQVRVRGETRLRELSVPVPSAPTLETVLGKLTQPPRVHFRSRPGTTGNVVEGVVALASAATMAALHASIFTVVAIGGALGSIAVGRRLLSSKVMLTDALFRSGEDSCELEEINRVTWKPWTSELGHPGVELDFELKVRPGFTVYVSDGAKELVEALGRCGVKCELRA